MELNRNNSFEEIQRRVERKVWQELDGTQADFHTVHTFPESVIVRNTVDEKYYEVPYVIQDGQVYLGELAEVESVYVYKKLQEHNIDPATKNMGVTELTGPIVKKDDDRRIAYAAVLVPGEADSDGETVTKAKIEQAAHEWMQSYRNVDLQHTLNNVAVPVESYIAPKAMEVEGDITLPEGTWILASKVNDETTWQAVKDGHLTGYSVMGIRRSTLESATKSDEVALKRTLLRDLGNDWVACAVSIVDEPAVPKAKFFALKSQNEPAVNKESLVDKITGFFKGSTKAGRTLSEENYQKLKTAMETLQEVLELGEAERQGQDTDVSQQMGSSKNEGGVDMTTEEIKNMVTEAVKEAVKPLQEEVDALKSTGENSEAGEGEENTNSTGEETGDEDVQSLKEQVKELQDFKANVEKMVNKGAIVSKGLKGQDNDGEEETEKREALKGRDTFGRKVKK